MTTEKPWPQWVEMVSLALVLGCICALVGYARYHNWFGLIGVIS